MTENLLKPFCINVFGIFLAPIFRYLIEYIAIKVNPE